MPGVRQPAVAGAFYEARPEALRQSIEQCFLHPRGPGALPAVNPSGPGLISGLISPHAGYSYSGPAAAYSYAALAADGRPEVIVILGPSHHTLSRQGAISTAEAWRTPLGEALLDHKLAGKLVEASELVEYDELPHHEEHSLEVQVPFLQYIFGDAIPPIVPVCIQSHPTGGREQLIADAKALGETLAQAVGARHAVVVASTDFSHQVPQEVAEREDRMALAEIEVLDPAGLLNTVASRRISMCGPVPVAIAMSFCRARGKHAAEVLTYYTSGDIIGDHRGVVGYASAVIRRVGGETV